MPGTETNEERKQRKRLLSSQISDLNERINELKKQRDTLQKELDVLNICEATTAALHLIEECDEHNSMEVEIHRNSKTTPIMDQFYNSEYQFLIIKTPFELDMRCTVKTSCSQFKVFISKRISLVIIRRESAGEIVYAKDPGLTMTDLKMSIVENTFDISNESNRHRLSALDSEISQLDITNNDAGDYIPFRSICCLGAQTYQNQTGYGSEYHGDELVYEGTLYGETTGFLIIGVRIEN